MSDLIREVAKRIELIEQSLVHFRAELESLYSVKAQLERIGTIVSVAAAVKEKQSGRRGLKAEGRTREVFELCNAKQKFTAAILAKVLGVKLKRMRDTLGELHRKGYFDREGSVYSISNEGVKLYGRSIDYIGRPLTKCRAALTREIDKLGGL